jgi:hypothetical protein
LGPIVGLQPSSLFDLETGPVRRRPFDHVVKDGFIRSDLYRAMVESFPACPSGSGPTGHSVFWGDPEFDALVAASEPWRQFHEAVQTQEFVDLCLAQVADELVRGGCLVDPARLRYVAYVESRADKERRHIEGPAPPPDRVWVRTDIHQAHTGYDRGCHLDHRRRVMTVLIYFCDAREIAMDGGTLELLPVGRDELSWWERLGVRRVAPRQNLAVMFACSPRSHHRVTPVRAQAAFRNYIQISISLSQDAWPA